MAQTQDVKLPHNNLARSANGGSERRFEEPDADRRTGWADWLICEILRREAEVTILHYRDKLMFNRADSAGCADAILRCNVHESDSGREASYIFVIPADAFGFAVNVIQVGT